MKLILTQEVTGLGAAGEVVEVKDGYGRNYLLPRGVAMPWTEGGENDVEAIRRARRAREIADLDTAEEYRSRLEATPVQVSVRAGNSGRLFGAVTPAEIAEAIVGAGGPSVDKRRIEVGSPIKSTGTHSVQVRLHPEVAATINVEVRAA